MEEKSGKNTVFRVKTKFNFKKFTLASYKQKNPERDSATSFCRIS